MTALEPLAGGSRAAASLSFRRSLQSAAVQVNRLSDL